MALLSLVVMAGPGCGGEGGASDEAPDGGSVVDDAGDRPRTSEPLPCAPCTDSDRYDYEGDGIYEVPLAPGDGELSEAAVTLVPEAQLRVDEGVVILEYALPVELTGVVQQVELSGELPAGDAPLTLDGSAGTATCYLDDVTEDSFDLFCLEELPGVTVDVAALQILLESRGLHEDLIRAHIEVSVLFMEDPIGILEATLSLDG